MRWKEIFIGAAITLVVTVIGGLLVYKFTQAPDNNKEEALSYEVDKQVAFEGIANKVSIGSAKIANTGGQAAKDVTAVFKVLNSSFLEFKSASSSGGEPTLKISDDKKSVLLSIKNLLPGEIITTTFLLSNETKIDVQLRSDKSIGKAGQTYKIESTKKNKLNLFLGDFVPLLIIVAVIPIYFILRYLRNPEKSIYSCKNNTGFVLLHTGLNNVANEILNEAIKNGEEGCHAIANYALSLALTDNIDESKKYINAANFLAQSKHERAVIKFNTSIISFIGGNEEVAIQNLKEAINFSKKDIISYCKKSIHIRDMMTKCNDIKELVENS